MKKLTLVFTTVLLLVLTAKTVAAKPSASPFRVNREKVEQLQATAQARVLERRRVNIGRFLGNMVARLRAFVARLEKLIARIESRLEKIAEESPDTDLATIQANIDEAKALLEATKDKIAELEGLGDELVDSDTPREIFMDIKEKLAHIKGDLQEVHRLLVHVIGDIKGLRVGDENNE